MDSELLRPLPAQHIARGCYVKPSGAPIKSQVCSGPNWAQAHALHHGPLSPAPWAPRPRAHGLFIWSAVSPICPLVPCDLLMSVSTLVWFAMGLALIAIASALLAHATYAFHTGSICHTQSRRNAAIVGILAIIGSPFEESMGQGTPDKGPMCEGPMGPGPLEKASQGPTGIP